MEAEEMDLDSSKNKDGWRLCLSRARHTRGGGPVAVQVSEGSKKHTLEMRLTGQNAVDYTGRALRIALQKMGGNLSCWSQGRFWSTAPTGHGGAMEPSRHRDA